MYHSKLVALLRTLKPAEQRHFKKWLKSPIHNPNETLSKFYDFFESREGFTPRSLQRERAYTYLFGDQPYHDLTIRRTMSEFLTVLEEFLTYEAWQKDAVARHLALARLYHDRQLPDAAEKQLATAALQLEALPMRDAAWHLYAYRVQEERFRQAPARDGALNLQEIGDELSYFFVAELLRNACGAASHSAVYRTAYRVPYLEVILNNAAAGVYQSVPLIQLYYHCYCCLTQPELTEHFFALKQMLPNAAAWLPTSECRDVFLVGVNYCIRRMNVDGHSFLREAFDLYREGLEKGVFMEEGMISRFTFKNIATAALALGETAWAAQFIQGYAPLLPPAYRTSYEHFCLAKLFYLQQEHARVQDLLQQLESDDVFLELDARLLLLKVYMEIAEWRLLRGFLTTFERYVRRKKKLAYHAPLYLNIIHFAQRILLLRSGKRRFSTEEIEQLQQQIKETKPLSEREWLLKMVGV